MKLLVVLLSLFGVAAAEAAPQARVAQRVCSGVCNSGNAAAGTDTTQLSYLAATSRPRLILDYPLTPAAGSATLWGAAQGLYRLEDRFLPVRWGAERSFLTRSAGILYRLARLTLVDLPLEVLHDVVRHEVVGHGGRGRLVGGSARRYTIALPPPYGSGGGSAAFDFDPSQVTWDERTAYVAGGLESTLLGLTTIEDRWTLSGTMDFREALHYVVGVLNRAGYVRDANGGRVRSGHDVENYLFGLDPNGDRFVNWDDAERLHRQVLVEFVNFPFYVALVHVFHQFVFNGNTHSPAIRIPIAGAYVTPQSHLILAPYGAEYDLRILAAREGRLYGMSIRKGAGINALGAGIRATDILRWPHFSLDTRLEVWRQPQLHLNPSRDVNRSNRSGLLVSATVRWDVGAPVILTSELGLKSRGYVPGEPLSAAPIVRLGVLLAN